MKKFEVKAKVWLYPSETASWHFVSVDKKNSEKIKGAYKGLRRGFGAVPVEVTLGKTRWKTSVFPDKKSGTYLLPLKADVRRKEDISVGDTVGFSLEIQK